MKSCGEPRSARSGSTSQKIGNLTRSTLNLSKDNVIFAVRSVDAQGHRSLPVVPAPER